MKTVQRMLQGKGGFGGAPEKPQSHDESTPHIDAPASAGNARQEAHDKVIEGLTVLAHDFPAAEDLLTNFEKQFQTWSGGGQEVPQGPKAGPAEGVDIPSAKDLPSGEFEQAPQPVPDQKPNRGGPPAEKGVPFWRRRASQSA